MVALFQNAPEQQPAQSLPTLPSGSPLAAALMRQPSSFQAPTPAWGQIPLTSLASMMQGQQSAPQTNAFTNQALGIQPGVSPPPQPTISGDGSQGATTPGLSGQPSLVSDALPNAPGNISMGNPNGAPLLPGGQSAGPQIGAAAPGMPTAGQPGQLGLLGSLYSSGLYGGQPGSPFTYAPGSLTGGNQ